MPSIERDVLGMTLTVGLDDGQWRWWLCHAHTSSSMSRGEAADMVDAIGQVFDALALRLIADPQVQPSPYSVPRR